MYDISISGLKELHSEVNSDHNMKPIKSLCEIRKNGTEIVFNSFLSALPLERIRRPFDVMSRAHSTPWFLEIWEKCMKTAVSVKRREGVELTLEDIPTAIWDPAFRECNYLVDSLRDKTIKLSEVDHYFKAQADRKLQLQRFCVGIRVSIGSETKTDLEWIDDAVRHMEDYWSLMNLSKAARVVVELKGKLALSGDFVAIEILLNEVSVLSNYNYNMMVTTLSMYR